MERTVSGMAETLVKICGLQDVEVLKSMLHLPLDYIDLYSLLVVAGLLWSVLPN